MKDVYGLEPAKSPGQCLVLSRCMPELAGLTLFPPWTESPLKESMCAQVSGRTSSFTEHLMGRGRGGLSHHILHSNPLRTFTRHSCSPKAPGPHNAQPYWFPLLLHFPSQKCILSLEHAHEHFTQPSLPLSPLLLPTTNQSSLQTRAVFSPR